VFGICVSESKGGKKKHERMSFFTWATSGWRSVTPRSDALVACNVAVSHVICSWMAEGRWLRPSRTARRRVVYVAVCAVSVSEQRLFLVVVDSSIIA
jgi:hypothetical protein